MTKNKIATIKELAELMGVEPLKMRRTLVEIGLGVLQNEAERMLAHENWDKKALLNGEKVPSIRHFRAAWDEMTRD